MINYTIYYLLFFCFNYLAIIVLIIGSIMNLIKTADKNLYSASLLVLVAFTLAAFSLID